MFALFLLGSCSSVMEGIIGGTEKEAEEKPAKEADKAEAKAEEKNSIPANA